MKPLEPLKKAIKKSRFSRREIAERLGISYSSLSGYLGGFVRMPEDIEQELQELLRSEVNCIQIGGD